MVWNKRGGGYRVYHPNELEKLFFYNNEIWLKRRHLSWEHPNATIAWDTLQFIYNTHTSTCNKNHWQIFWKEKQKHTNRQITHNSHVMHIRFKTVLPFLFVTQTRDYLCF